MAELENVKNAAGDEKSALEKKSEKTKKAAEKKSGDKKPNIFVRIGKFLKNCVTELKKVTWLSKANTIRYSTLVLVALVLLAVAIGAFDYLCTWVINLLGSLV